MLGSGLIKPFILLVLFTCVVTGAILPAEQQQVDEQPVRYDNYKVYKVTIENVEQYDQLMSLESELKVIEHIQLIIL